MKTMTNPLEEWTRILDDARSNYFHLNPTGSIYGLVTEQASAVLRKLAELQEETHDEKVWSFKDLCDARLQALVDACRAVCVTCAAPVSVLDNQPSHSWWADIGIGKVHDGTSTRYVGCLPIRRLIAAHHAKHDPKPTCEPICDTATNEVRCACGSDFHTPKPNPCKHENARPIASGPHTFLVSVKCDDCDMERERGWISEWKNPKPTCEHHRKDCDEETPDMASLVHCSKCGATRRRGWIGPWESKVN